MNSEESDKIDKGLLNDADCEELVKALIIWIIQGRRAAYEYNDRGEEKEFPS